MIKGSVLKMPKSYKLFHEGSEATRDPTTNSDEASLTLRFHNIGHKTPGFRAPLFKQIPALRLVPCRASRADLAEAATQGDV